MQPSESKYSMNDKIQLVETYVWASVVLIVTIILAGIVIAMLYSVTFITQPIKSLAPIDQAYLKMMNDIVLLIVGGIGGVMSRKGVQAISDRVSTPTPPATVSTPSTPVSVPSTPIPTPSNALPVWVNPPLDESWVPPPPPNTPPQHLEADSVREENLHMVEDALNILKALCDTSSTRKVSYMKEAPQLRENDIPQSFEYNGAMIFISKFFPILKPHLF